MSHPLTLLVEWYRTQCDGLWEHSYGISITTLDNPGFSIGIDLKGTPLEHAIFQPLSLESDPSGGGEWISCSKSGDARWLGFCSPRALEQVLEIFLKWSSEQSPPAGP